MLRTNKYMLKAHNLYYVRIKEIRERVVALKQQLTKGEFVEHDLVKFAKRLREADKSHIPKDPVHPDYRLSGKLKRYNRYKRGLQRYRLFFCYSTLPPIIVYLYLNDDKTLRKEGSKTDPYEVFRALVSKGKVSSNPNDERTKKFIRDYI